MYTGTSILTAVNPGVDNGRSADRDRRLPSFPRRPPSTGTLHPPPIASPLYMTLGACAGGGGGGGDSFRALSPPRLAYSCVGDGTVSRQVGEVPQGADPRPQKMANNLQRQGRSARLVERRSYCTERLLAGRKFADAHSSR